MTPSSTFRLRTAEPRDAGEIAAVHLASRRDAMPWLPEAHPDEETYAWVAEHVIPHREVWVAEADGRVVGVASLEGDSLEQLYILPGSQGMGIGSALFDKARELRPAGFEFYAFQRNERARGFYERRGCVAVELGDGSGNEEGEPDVRYRWAPTARE